MKNRLMTLGALLALASGHNAEAVVPQKVDFQDYVQSISERSHQTDRLWRKSSIETQHNKGAKVITSSDKALGPTSYWGSIYTPADEEWTYACDYTYITVGEYGTQSIQSAIITIYDADLKEYRKFTAQFELGEHETSINSVQVAPTLTKKFFNINDAYEVMVYIHATTDDYTGHSYTQVYTLSDGSLVTTLEGDNIASVNMATDSWSENFTMVFMRESTVITEEDFQYNLYFDVYSKAGWGTGCTLEHTFDVDYALVAGAGNYALPFLIKKHNNRIYYALPRYEKPYFVSDWSEDITPDNNFVIDLYDNAFNLLNTTKIPMTLEDGAIFSFPGLGELNGFDDLCFDLFSEGDEPCYVVGVENYISASDDFTTSIYVYDIDGNRISTLMTDAKDYLQMSDIPGFERQFCIYRPTDNGGFFDFINFPSGHLAASIDILIGNSNISTTLDRVVSGTTYMYVSSLVNGFVDNDDNVIHKLAWYNADGSFDRFAEINLGKNVVMAQPNVSAEVLDPYLFDTTDEYEYMFLVKEALNDGTSRSKEMFRLYSENSNLLLELGPNAETNEYLSLIYVINPKSNNPKLVVAYDGEAGYTLHPFDLPLTKFAKGEGTKENPYIITSAGELHTIQQAPRAYYELACDIDHKNVPWTGNDCDFTGVFDGKGHTIYNLTLSGSMFKSVSEGGEIKNVNIEGVNMTVDHSCGILTGYLNGGDAKASKITNVHINNANVNGSHDVDFGSIASEVNVMSEITDCSVTNAHINFGKSGIVGGIVGRQSTGSVISTCLFDGSIIAETAGGIAGESQRGDEKIVNCHAHVDINAEEVAGGIIGYSSRSILANCYVDGNVHASGIKTAYSGGIAGQIKSKYDEEPGEIIINNCIVAANVSASAESAKAIAHRIAGFTSGDEWLVDWESDDPNVDWSDPSTYPYIPGLPEAYLGTNYAIGTDKIDPEIADDTNSPEGKTMDKTELTKEFASAHGWKLGNDKESPWKFAGSAIALYFEVFNLTAAFDTIELSANHDCNTVEVAFTCDRTYGQYIDVETSDDTIARIVSQEVSTDGYSVICTVEYVSDGRCILQATLGDATASCTVIAKKTSIKDEINAVNNLIFDGTTLHAEGHIRVYNMQGMLVAEGNNTLQVSYLAKGNAYIAVCGDQKLKIKF